VKTKDSDLSRGGAKAHRLKLTAGTVVAAILCYLLASCSVVAGDVRFELTGDNLPQDKPADDFSWGVALGDVTADGYLDIIFADSGQNRLHINDGSGTFGDVTAGNMPQVNDLSWAAALGDFNGDGHLDAVFANTGQNRLLFNDGSGVFSDVTETNLPEDNYDSRDVAVGDVNGDGHLDIVFATRFGPNQLLLNDGAGVFHDAPPADFSSGGSNTRGVALGDLNGDGYLDIVFAVKDAQNRLLLSNGTGALSDVTKTNLPADYDNSRGIALGDINGDGYLDIVFANRLSNEGQSKVYLNDGAGVFSDVTLTNLPKANLWSTDVALADVDRDSDLDIVFANFDGPCVVYLNDGSGIFQDVASTQLPAGNQQSLGVALGDVADHDDLDVVFANAGQNSLWHNVTEHSVRFGPACPACCQPNP
jgi:hypothetical protein